MAKKRLDMRIDPLLLDRIHKSMAASSGPVKNRTDWVEQACYEKVLKEEEAHAKR